MFEKLFKWLFEEDGYYKVISIVLLLLGILVCVSYCDEKKDSDEITEWKKEVAQREKETADNREAFFNKYREALNQFDSESDFSFWLDNRANYEAIIFMYELIIYIDDEYDYEDGLADIISYLKWTEPEIMYRYQYE